MSNSQQEFTNISSANTGPSTNTNQPPTAIHQPQPSPAQRSVPAQASLSLNKNYLTSIAGILRLCLIVNKFYI